jgi:hypothetical protein
LISFALMGAIGAGDWATGWAVSFTLLYLIPIATAAWVVGRRAGMMMCVVATGMRLATNLPSPMSPATILWNAGIAFGIFLTFAGLLSHLRTANQNFPILRSLGKSVGFGLGLAALLALIGLLAERKLSAAPQTVSGFLARLPASAPSKPAQPGSPLADLSARAGVCTRLSRAILLGSRDLKLSSCVNQPKPGDADARRLPNLADYDGGPGTKLALLLYLDRQNCKFPMDDYAWHQGRLRMYLRNQVTENQRALAETAALADRAASFADALGDGSTWPADLTPLLPGSRENWLGYCLASLNDAIVARNLDGARRWATELAGAAFALNDLHLWLEFLSENYLSSLDFQEKCASLFAETTQTGEPYDRETDISRFPAGLVTMHGVSNFYELEHQAERFFTMPADRSAEIATDAHLTPTSIWMPPAARENYVKIEGMLSAGNRKNWRAAARTPYEHSYLVNMLYRAGQSGAIDSVTDAVRRFDAIHPEASMGELLGVLMYRGHSFAGLDWADRFQPQLVEAAKRLSGSDAEAFLQACRLTYQFDQSDTYAVTFTLRDALESKRLDCVRATDMIGAIFRDSGRPRFGHVRWSSGIRGHSVAAYVGTENGKSKVLLADGLNPPEQPEVWPDAYFHGHAWPAVVGKYPNPYAVELYVRGLDNYIWAEGYIVRGANAGTLMKAGIPYASHRANAETKKVYEGPYPE